jgi:hypothetical protein
VTEPNDKFLDEYLRRESPVSQHYRELEADAVPPELDAAVLAQARAAVEKPKVGKPRWTQWAAPLAIAASAVMAVAVVLDIGVQEEVRLPAPLTETTVEPPATAPQVQEAPAAAPDEPVAAAPPPMPQAAPMPAPASAPAEDIRAQRERAERAMQAERAARAAVQSDRAASARRLESGRVSQAEAEAQRKAAVESVVVSSSRPPQQAMGELPVVVLAEPAENQSLAVQVAPPKLDVPSDASGADSPVTAAAERPAAATAAFAPAAPPHLEPQEWLERIRRLRQEGKVLEADEQWREFVAAYPDYEVEKTDPARPTDAR